MVYFTDVLTQYGCMMLVGGLVVYTFEEIKGIIKFIILNG